jgi:hypothetical protein
MEGMRDTHNVLVRKREGKRPLAITGLRWEDQADIKMELKYIGCEDVDRTHVAQVTGCCENSD